MILRLHVLDLAKQYDQMFEKYTVYTVKETNANLLFERLYGNKANLIMSNGIKYWILPQK